MRVLQINCVNKFGSTGRIVAQISDYLDQREIDNRIAHGIPSVNDEHSYVINSKLDAHFHSFMSRKLCMQGLCSSFATKKLVKYIEKYDPDIIHLHNLHGHYLNYNILFRYLKNSRAKVVWTLHDCWAVTGKCSHFTKAACYKWEQDEGCNNCPQLHTYPDSTFDRSAKNFALKKKLFTTVENLTAVTVSEWLKGVCERSYLKDKRIVHIHNGIDTKIFRPVQSDVLKQLGIENKNVVLGVSNIWNGQKGEEQFIELSKRLPEDYVVVLVGKNSENVAKNSEKIVAVAQTKNQEELVKLYSAASVFVSTSIEESCSLVVLEALACGTPAIVYNSTALPEIVPEKCGAVVEVGDTDALVLAVADIAGNSEMYRQNCSAFVNDNYTVQIMCENYYKLYGELLGEKQ